MQIGGRSDERDWLCEVIDAARPGQEPLTLTEAQDAFPGEWRRFEKRWERVREAGMVGV
jgi:hypothetical protein